MEVLHGSLERRFCDSVNLVNVVQLKLPGLFLASAVFNLMLPVMPVLALT